MLTTTVDGLWALQVLTGIETVAPELGLRPHLPSVEPKQLVWAHPVAAELRDVGVLDESGEVDRTVVEWLTVLSRRDVALFVQIRTPEDDEPARVLIARFAQWWVAIERSADLVRLSGVGTATTEASASSMIYAEIERLCGQNAAAPLRPVTLDSDALRATADHQALQEFLAGQHLEADQLRTLALAADRHRSAQASIVAIQCGVASGRAHRMHIEASAVTIIDSPAGRLVAEDIHSAGKKWMIIAPGTQGNIAAAISHLVRRLPADQEWYSYRKVV
ncbi:ESX secretion-associated protein EspG [Mycobacterium asiaticum]|uniref:Secretion protein EspG n=1 Tax=Mycobacterium asiaticum TaxID=1790 RepID=A0A1A3MS35_MYCAS|nr:ESX secretion-associated protein EspG [Mycobacterium asiaticum]OBK12331.1 secretion protein EspG [Mycobacterium asiaticum]